MIKVLDITNTSGSIKQKRGWYQLIARYTYF